MERLTFSRMATRRTCPRQDWYRYELGLRREQQNIALRLGSVYALGKELWRKHRQPDQAIMTATAGYNDVPAWATPYEWAIERETAATLLAGYFWRYENDDLEFLAAELTFDIPLVNPLTGRPSKTFSMAGKIDGIVQRSQAAMIHEDKLTAADVSDGSDYWLRLRYDGQLSQYMIAARALGYDVNTAIYDVTRRPTIRPGHMPVVDSNGFKIVLDATGTRVLKGNGEPRQSASTADGYVLQTTPETPEAWGQRLLDDIAARPDWYFARREIPRLDQDLDDYRAEVWQQAHQLRECRSNGWWFRNVSPLTCKNCEYREPCLSGVEVSRETPPAGFVVLDDPHPELQKAEDAD